MITRYLLKVNTKRLFGMHVTVANTVANTVLGMVQGAGKTLQYRHKFHVFPHVF